MGTTTPEEILDDWYDVCEVMGTEQRTSKIILESYMGLGPAIYFRFDGRLIVHREIYPKVLELLKEKGYLEESRTGRGTNTLSGWVLSDVAKKRIKDYDREGNKQSAKHGNGWRGNNTVVSARGAPIAGLLHKAPRKSHA